MVKTFPACGRAYLLARVDSFLLFNFFPQFSFLLVVAATAAGGFETRSFSVEHVVRPRPEYSGYLPGGVILLLGSISAVCVSLWVAWEPFEYSVLSTRGIFIFSPEEACFLEFFFRSAQVLFVAIRQPPF